MGIAFKPDIYGLSGVLIAHVFFNFPLAVRLFLNALETIPEPSWKLAATLRMSAIQRLRILCLPVLRASLPGVAGMIFLLCMTSFTLVLVLGGGPSATTLEVAIYQSLTYDLDLPRAAALTLLQIALAGAALAALALTGAPPDLSGGGGRSRWSPALAGKEKPPPPRLSSSPPFSSPRRLPPSPRTGCAPIIWAFLRRRASASRSGTAS